MVGHAALDRVIGVRIPASQPNWIGAAPLGPPLGPRAGPLAPRLEHVIAVGATDHEDNRAVFSIGISVLPAPDGPFIHPRGAERMKLCSSHNRPAPEAVTSARADVRPTGAPAFNAFVRHRSTFAPFLRQADFVAFGRGQPAGTGSAQILRSMSPNSRRFRCPSASRSQ